MQGFSPSVIVLVNMARLGGLSLCTTFWLLCTVIAVHADKCKTGCHGVTPNLFKYQEGTTYKYNYESTIDISLSSAEQHTTTKVTATVLLTQQGNCNQVLRLQNVQVFGPDAKKYGGLENIDKAIRLNFHDGHLEDEICTEAGETINSLNIKRAVASLFQAATKDTEESDVFGQCANDITTHKDGNVLVIKKSRDLTRCSHRESIRQDFMATSLNLQAVPGTSHFISHMDSEQKVAKGIMEQAVVTENYLYKPFSDGKDHGAKAIVTTKMTLAGQSKEKVTAKATEPKSIFFENPHIDTLKTSNVDSILNALKETKKTMDISVTEKSAATFYQLIKVLRESRKSDILAVYGQVKSGAGGFQDKDGARKVFFDALFRTGTGEAVEVVVELMKNKELSEIEQKLVYLSFSFIKHATKGSLTSASMLLDQPNLPREAYLGIGNLAGRYCSEHTCNNVDELNKLIAKLAGKLNAQPADRKTENEVIAALKSLANIHHLSDAVAEKLIPIMNEKKAPSRLRVAALETAASDACKPKLHAAAMNLLKNRNEDSEIRIKAYLIVVECPDQKTAAALQELLDSEPVYQVGGYITSHLRNLRASANPDREHAKQHLSGVRTAKKFPIDPRKYSFNSEISYNCDTVGAGNVLESDVIYSQNSFVPRSVNLNLTTEMFGHSFNFMEIGFRQENWEKLAEHYFGPLGVFSTNAPEDLYKSGKESVTKIVDHLKQRLEKTRGKRDVSRQEIDAFAKQVKILGSELNKDLEYDVNVKLFGSEMLFLSINEDIQKLTPESIIDKIFDHVDNGIEKAKNFEYHMKNHLLFLDTEISYPTSSGFPLKWYLKGTAAVHFITSGNMDLRQIIKDPKNAEMKLKIIPSANIDFTGGFSLDAHFVKTGLQINTNILSSTGTDLTIKLLDNKGIDVKIGVPVSNQKIIGFSHEIHFSTEELGKPEVPTALKFKDKKKEASMCFDQLTPVIGLTVCAEMSMPSTLATNHVAFPMNGNMNMQLSIEAEDLKEYHFKALLKEPNSHSKALEITFSTPGSSTPREVSLLLEAATEPNKMLKATAKYLQNQAVAEALLTDNAQEKSAMVRFQYVDKEYLAKIGVSVSGNDAKQIYQPLIEYQTPTDIVKTKGDRKPDYTVEGQIIAEKDGDKRKYTFDNIKLIAPSQPNIQIHGYLAKEGPTSYAADMEVSRENVKMHGKGKVAYSTEGVKLNAQLENSVNPNANFNVKLDFKRGEREFENTFSVIHGQDLSSKKHQLTISNSAKYKYENKDDFDFAMKNKVTYPLLNVEGKLDVHTTNKQFNYDMTVAYDKFKLESELDAKVAQKVLGDYDIKFELKAMNNKLEVKAKRDINGDKSNIHNSVELSGRKYSLDGTVTHHCKPNDLNVGTDLTIKIHDKPDPIKIDTSLITNTQELDTHAKISIGADNVVDIEIKGARGPEPHGTLKVIIKNMVNANGQFKVSGGKGTGDLLVEIPKMNRKIKADTSFTCQDPTHNAILNIYFDFEKDNSKKLHLETNNQLTKHSFDTKNKLELLSYTMSANAKGKYDGTFMHGTQVGDFEIVLPNGHVITGLLDRDCKLHDKPGHGKLHANLAHQESAGGPKRFVDVQAEAKDVDMKKKYMDVTYHITAENIDGKNIKADIHHKHDHNDGKHNSMYKSKIYGSMMPNPLELEMVGHYSISAGNHKGSVMYGTKAGIKGAFNYAHEDGKPCSGDMEMEVIIPNDKYKNFKIKMGGKNFVPKEADGTYEGEGTVEAILNNEKSVKLHSNAKANIHEGHFSTELVMPDGQPLGVSGKYKREKSETGGKMHGEIDLKYAKDKEVKAGLTLNKIHDDEVGFEVDLATPNEHAKEIQLKVHSKRSSNNKHFNNEVTLTADGKKFILTNELDLNELSPSFDLKLTHPDGKVSHVHAGMDRVSPKHIKGQVKIENIQDFNLEASADADLESVDNFHITMHINSEKLKMDKIKLEVFNKPNKNGKKIQFEAKSGSKNLLSGSTTYKANEESGKFIVEGSGTVKVKEDSRTATFKFIKQQLHDGGEQGMEMVLNAQIGNQGVVSELKVTNKQFRSVNSYCEDKGQCAQFNVETKVNTVSADEFGHELEVNIDLRKLGLSHEFGLKSVTNRKGFVLDHTVDIHFESGSDSKYQYSLYIHPKEAGIQFKIPKRMISLEAKGDFKHDKAKKTGSIDAELALYMNKEAEPAKKAVLSYTCNHGGDENSGHAKVEIKLATPGLPKELVVIYNNKYDVPSKTAESTIDLDIFAKKNQKITVALKAYVEKLDSGYKIVGEGNAVSKGLNLDAKYSEVMAVSTKEFYYHLKFDTQIDKSKYENEILTKINPKKVELLAKAFNKNIAHLDANMELSKDSQVIDATISGVGTEKGGDYLSHTEVKNFNSFTSELARKAHPEDKMKVSSGFIVGQIADFRIEVIKGGKKNDVAHASIKLDDTNFMRPDFGVDTEFIQKTLIPGLQKQFTDVTHSLKTDVEEVSKLASAESKHLSEIVKKSMPNVKPTVEYYKQELIKLKDELINDKTLQQVSEQFKKIFGTVMHTISEVYAKFEELGEKIVALSSDTFAKITDVIAKDVLPTIKEVGSKVLDIYLSLMKSVYDVAMLYIVKLSEILKAHQTELKHMATVMSEAFQDFGRLFVKFFNQIKEDLQAVVKNLYDQVKALPIMEELEQRYKEIMSGMPVPEQIVHFIDEIFGAVRDVMPTDETRSFINVVHDYLTRKLKNEAVDDIAAMKQMYTSLMKAINSLIKFVQNQQPNTTDYKSILNNIVPVRLDRFYALPQKLSAFKFSPISVLFGGDLPSVKQFITGQSLKDIIPPFTHHATIVDGKHIFTFDNRHLTFPGKCNYVLAKDAVNGNFTVIGQYKDGHIEALTFADKHDVITIKKDGKITVNGKDAELPVRNKELEVFRLYDTVNVISKAGVHIIAQPELHGIGMYVNGFYHGQMRGLLGNGNNEPYDDFTLPNGKITEKESDFGNAFRINNKCGEVKTVDHSHHATNEKCEHMFSSESSMRLCFALVDRVPYKQACEHGMGAGEADIEKYIAGAYASECRHRGIPINVPKEFVKCYNSEKPTELNDQFSVKVPTKSADIVVVVEQNKNNEAIFKDLVQPVITQITNELNAKGINDVEYSLMGYGGEYQKYPSHYTNGGKLAFHSKMGSVKFTDPTPHTPIDVGCPQANEFLEYIHKFVEEAKYQLKMTPETDALSEVLNYPFRANAAKVVIFVKGENKVKFSPLFMLTKYISRFSRTDGIHMNLITPLENMKLSGKDPKQVKNIVGFNEHVVYTNGDAKKKAEGSSDLRKQLEFGLDYGADYFETRHGGNVFISNNFAQAKGGQKKQFVQVVSHVIADDIINTEYGFDCVCQRSSFITAKNVCKVVTKK